MALEKLLPEDGKIVVIPMDDGMLDGPVGGLVDMPGKVKQIVEGGADAILGFLGVYKQCKDHLKKTKFVLNVTASTKYSMNPQEKVQLYDVSQAVDLGINGIAVHVNVGSVHLHDQLQILGRVAADCTKYKIPLLAIAYPRGEMMREDGLVEGTIYAARMAAEAGADIVKTKYTGSVETFRQVIEGCPVPVIMAGGPKIPEDQILANIENCMTIGRNSFHHENTTEFVRKVYGIVHNKQ
ncbi:MAG: fructose-bisphosphate aldolase [Candidatus Woesearchaeota archaeon]|nr:fructose-bisphosphate aldolase [Candidatus Woesearchaeota archaeon]